MRGTRVDIGAEDIVAANGPRIPSADDLVDGKPQDYFREVQVVVTRPDESAQAALPVQIAQRVDRARLLWERWMREASGNRMVVCTQVSADCGDARSDVSELRWNAARKGPAAGPLTMDVVVTNGGVRPAAGIVARLETTLGLAGAAMKSATKDVGTLAAGASVTVPFEVDARSVPCGTELVVKARHAKSVPPQPHAAELAGGRREPGERGLRGRGGLGGEPGRQRHLGRRHVGTGHAGADGDRGGQQPGAARGGSLGRWRPGHGGGCSGPRATPSCAADAPPSNRRSSTPATGESRACATGSAFPA